MIKQTETFVILTQSVSDYYSVTQMKEVGSSQLRHTDSAYTFCKWTL